MALPKKVCQRAEPKDKMRTHPPLFTFSRARSTAACQIPSPRNVSMTCPFRKNAEDTRGSLHKALNSSGEPKGKSARVGETNVRRAHRPTRRLGVKVRCG